MTLYFISLGLSDENDISLKALETARKCDLLFAEFYTHKLNTTKEKIEKVIGKEIRELSRKEVEEKSEIILEPAKTIDVGLLVGGDAFCATTHLALKHDAMKLGIKTKVIHGSSIFSAISETGLHMYKFGTTITIPFPEKLKGKPPISAYERLKDNKERGLHTLLLLDIVAEENRYMTVNEAMNILLDIEEHRKENVFTAYTEVIVFARAGSDDAEIAYGNVAEFIDRDFGKPSMCMIVPGVLHFTEREYLEMLKNDKR